MLYLGLNLPAADVRPSSHKNDGKKGLLTKYSFDTGEAKRFVQPVLSLGSSGAGCESRACGAGHLMT
jgi:hypothetical protein